jgi:hypothetical protein
VFVQTISFEATGAHHSRAPLSKGFEVSPGEVKHDSTTGIQRMTFNVDMYPWECGRKRTVMVRSLDIRRKANPRKRPEFHRPAEHWTVAIASQLCPGVSRSAIAGQLQAFRILSGSCRRQEKGKHKGC